MDTKAERAADQLTKFDHYSSLESYPDLFGLAHETVVIESFGGTETETGRLDVSAESKSMLNYMGRIRMDLYSNLVENTARIKVYENFRASVDTAIQKVSKRNDTLKEILHNVRYVLDANSNAKEELPENIDYSAGEAIASYEKMADNSPKFDESLLLIAEVHQVVAERKNLRSYINRFCDYLRGIVMIPHPSSFEPHPSSFEPHPSSFEPHPSSFEPHPSSFDPHPSSFDPHPSSFDPHPSSFDPLDNSCREIDPIDKQSLSYVSDSVVDQEEEWNESELDAGYLESYNSNDKSIIRATQARIPATGKDTEKGYFVGTVSEDEIFTRAKYEKCAVVFRKQGQPFRSLSFKASSNSAIKHVLSEPGENSTLWFLDSMWYPSSRSAARDLERLKCAEGKTYRLKEIFGHLTKECLAYVDLSTIERIGTAYRGAADMEFLDFVTRFIMRNYFLPRALRQLHLSIPPLTPLAKLDPLHPGLYRGLELHLHFPGLQTDADAEWMMAVCRKLVHKFPCELRDVRGFYFKHCRLSEQNVKDFMKFLDGEFPKTKIVCVDCDQRTDQSCFRQQRIYEAMGFTFYDKAEEGLMNLRPAILD